MRKTKKAIVLMLAALMTAGSGMTTFAGPWEQTGSDWKYMQDNGTYATNGWQWIEGKSYYFDANGIMAKNTTVDGYTVNADGQWVVNGVVQTQGSTSGNSTGTSVNHNAGYDPAHPLAGKIDEWNLRLPSNTITGFSVCTDSLQALLTNQMDYYNYLDVANYAPLVDGMYIAERNGTTFYITEEDYIKGKQQDQQLYNWFCNWLNGMDFENMSEMDRAREIQKVMAQIEYEYDDNDTSDTYISTLIEKGGTCAECAMTACSLAKSLGLKSAVSGTGTHMVYYIQVDGVAYFGQNETLNLNTPTPDYVYFQ